MSKKKDHAVYFETLSTTGSGEVEVRPMNFTPRQLFKHFDRNPPKGLISMTVFIKGPYRNKKTPETILKEGLGKAGYKIIDFGMVPLGECGKVKLLGLRAKVTKDE